MDSPPEGPPHRPPLQSQTRALGDSELSPLLHSTRPAEEIDTAAVGGSEMEALLAGERPRPPVVRSSEHTMALSDFMSANGLAEGTPSAEWPSALPPAPAPTGPAPDAFALLASAPPAPHAPNAFAPTIPAPAISAPEGFAPEGFAPEGFAPEGFAPEGFAPSAPAAAQPPVTPLPPSFTAEAAFAAASGPAAAPPPAPREGAPRAAPPPPPAPKEGRPRASPIALILALAGASTLAAVIGMALFSSKHGASGSGAPNAAAPTAPANASGAPAAPAGSSAPAGDPEAEAKAALGRLREGIGACVRDVIGVLPGTSPAVPVTFALLKGGAYKSLSNDFRSPVYACTKYKETEAQRFQIQWQLVNNPSEGRGVAWIDDNADGKPDRAFGFKATLAKKNQADLGEIEPIDPVPAVMKTPEK